MNNATSQLMQTHNPSPATLGSPLGFDSSPSSLTETVPYEILVAIIEELDWVDVLRVRTVSRPILAASRERSVWEVICERHHVNDEPQPFSNRCFLEKKMAVCTASELEAAFLHPRKANTTQGSSTYLSHRRFNPPDGCRRQLLLPGGRWVITTTEPHYHVTCCDLDARKAPGEKNDQFVLAENPFASFALHPKIMVVHSPEIVVDTAHISSPYLRFNFAVFFSTSRLDNPPGIPRGYCKFIQVWNAGPRYDTGGHIVGLVSTLLSSFEIEPNGFLPVKNFALFGYYLSYQAPLSNFVCIVAWREASGRGVERHRVCNYSHERKNFLSDEYIGQLEHPLGV